MKGQIEVYKDKDYTACPVCGNAGKHREDCYVVRSLKVPTSVDYAQLYEGRRDARKELPNVIDRYLVYTENNGIHSFDLYHFHPGDYDNSGWIKFAKIRDDVIAWMPLPSPPAFV